MDFLSDFRIAARGLLRSKGFAFAGALTLALGIAATTTIFSVLYGVLLRPLPYRDADRLVVIEGEKDFSAGPRVMNYSAEVGLRVAIGAQRVNVIRLVLAEGARLSVVGVVAGLAGAYWATRLLSSLLCQVTPTDPGAFAGAALAMFLVALLATYLPARRPARVDPMTALRAE